MINRTIHFKILFKIHLFTNKFLKIELKIRFPTNHPDIENDIEGLDNPKKKIYTDIIDNKSHAIKDRN